MIEAQTAGHRRIPLQGAQTPVKGLWVAVDPRGGYSILEEATGCAISRHFENPEAALAATIEIGPLADWSAANGTRIHVPSETIDRINAIVQRWGGGAIAIAAP